MSKFAIGDKVRVVPDLPHFMANKVGVVVDCYQSVKTWKRGDIGPDVYEDMCMVEFPRCIIQFTEKQLEPAEAAEWRNTGIVCVD